MEDLTTEELIQKIKDDEWTNKLAASDQLVLRPSREVVLFLVQLLEDNNGEVRNASALALREIGDSYAVGPLIKAIKNPSNCHDRSTLVYALEKLDCSNYFLDIFGLALADKIDVQIAAIHILEDQKFFVDDDEIMRAYSMLEGSKDSRICYNDLYSFLKEIEEDEGGADAVKDR